MSHDTIHPPPAPTPVGDRGEAGAASARRVAGSGWLLIVAWTLTRGWMLRHWARACMFIADDPAYYNWQLGASLSTRLREYPVPVVWFLGLFRWLSNAQQGPYVASFAVGMAVLDAVFAALLWRAGSRAGAWFWMAFGFFMGPLVWFRFDVLPAVVVGTALLVLSRRPGLSGALVALGAAIKLWPALILLPLLHRDAPGRRRATGFAVAGMLLVLVSWADAGWQRLLSPVTWQRHRGLQIESITGSGLVGVWAWSHDPDRWAIQLSQFNAFEIYGPGVRTGLMISSVLMLLAAALAVFLGVRAWRRPTLDPFAACMAAVAIIAAFIVANKTLSPQYMFWLAAPIAVLVHHGRTTTQRARAGMLATFSLVIAALTQVVYPDHYDSIAYGNPPASGMSTVLVVRNLLLVVLCAVSTYWALRASRLRRHTAPVPLHAPAHPPAPLPAPHADPEPASDADER